MGKQQRVTININKKSSCAIVLSPPDSNKPISFSTNVKIDKRMKLNPMLTAARRPKNRAGKPSRPQNSYFLYMRNKINNPEYGKKQLKNRVKEIAKQLKDAPKEEKDLFEHYAGIVWETHTTQYKYYQWLSPSKNQQNHNGPENVQSTPLDSSPISTTSSLSSSESKPNNSPYASQFPESYDNQYANWDELHDFELYDQSEQIDSSVPSNLFSSSISPDQLNQNETIAFNSELMKDNQSFLAPETYSLPKYPSDQLDPIELFTPSNPGLIMNELPQQVHTIQCIRNQ